MMTRYKIKNRIRNKIKSEQGASLMIALLFFLVCAVVGSVVLTGATVTSRRTSGPDTDANRRRYALISARDLITEQMKSGNSSQSGSNQSGSDQSGSQVNQSENSGAASDGESSVSFEKSWEFTLVEQDDGSTSLSSSESSSKENAYVPQTFQPLNTSSTNPDHPDPLFSSLRKNMTEKVIAYYWPYFTCGKKATTQASSEVPPANSPDSDPWQTEFPITDWDQVLSGANGSASTGSGTSSSGESDTALANKYTIQTKDGQPLKITLDRLDRDDNFPTVYADVCMDSSFQIKIHLYCKENSGNSGNSSKTASDAIRPELWILYPLSDVSITYKTSPKENATGSGNSGNPAEGSVTYNRSVKIQVSWGQPLITSDENLLKTSD